MKLFSYQTKVNLANISFFHQNQIVVEPVKCQVYSVKSDMALRTNEHTCELCSLLSRVRF
jgi:hypothetical protein